MPSLYLAFRGTARALLARKGLRGEMVLHRLPVYCFRIRIRLNETVSGIVSNYLFLNFVFCVFVFTCVRSKWLEFMYCVQLCPSSYGGGSVAVNLYLCTEPSLFSLPPSLSAAPIELCEPLTPSWRNTAWLVCQTLSISGARRSRDCSPRHKHFGLLL